MSCVRPETAEALDLVCLPTPRDFRHRNLEYSIKQYYGPASGKPLIPPVDSRKPTSIGYSLGIHGLRHTFAQERVDEFIPSGITWSMALERTSQLMGHYRPDEILTYLP